MNKILMIVSFNLILISSLFCEENVKSIISDADQLISNRQYQSAFEILKEKDPNNENPVIVVKKVDIALKYFSKSIMHELFSFSNLGPDDDLYKIRMSSGSSVLYPLKVEDILSNLIKKYPDNADLYYSLGCYYYEVHSKYYKQWLKNDEELINLSRENLLKAEDLKKFDDISSFYIGMTYLLNNNFQKAIQYLSNTVEMNKKNADANYNLAYAYYQIKNFNNVIIYSRNSFELYQDFYYKKDAAILAANAYINLNEYENLLKDIDQAIKQDPKDFLSYNGKIIIYLKQNEFDKAYLICEEAFGNMYDFPELLSLINSDYIQFKRYDDLDKFYSNMIIKFSSNDEASGNLFLYKGIYYVKLNKKDEAKEAFDKSREHFNKVYDSNNEVFNLIDRWLKSLNH